MVVESVNNVTEVDPYAGLSVIEIKRLQYPYWAHVLSGIYLFFIGMFGLIENILVLLTFFKNKQLQSPTNIFILGVSVCDLCMTVFAIHICWINILYGEWFMGDLMCIFEGFAVYAFGLTSLYLLTAVSVDRYIVIAKPLLAPIISKRVAVLAVLACALGGTLWSTFPFLGWSSYGLENSGVFCGLEFHEKSFNNQSYIAAIFVFVFLIPLVVMAYCYINIWLTIKNVSKNSVWDMKSKVARKNLKIEKKMLKSCLIMCGCFWVCWSPYALTSFWETFGDGNQIPMFLFSFPGMMAKSQVAFNPIIYVATNKQFRKAFVSILPCADLKKALEKKEEEADKQKSSEATEAEDKKEAPATVEGGNGNPNAVAPAPGSEPPKVEC